MGSRYGRSSPKSSAAYDPSRHLAYYLAASVIGCFVVSFLQWIGDAIAGNLRPASVLLTTYFFSLVFGAVAVCCFPRCFAYRCGC